MQWRIYIWVEKKIHYRAVPLFTTLVVPRLLEETFTSHLSTDRPQLSQKISTLRMICWLGLCAQNLCASFPFFLTVWILSQRLLNGGVLANRCFALIRYSGCEQVHTASIDTEFMCSSGLFNLCCSFHWPRKWVARILMCPTLREEIKHFFTTLNL